MKNVLTLLLPLFLLFHPLSAQDEAHASASNSSATKIVELTILWRSPIDETTWEPLALTKLLTNTSDFTSEGNFYTVNNKLSVFGHEAIYIGMLGIDLIPGPNVMLKGNPESVMNYISEHYSLKFEQQENAYSVALEEHIRLIIAPHPALENTTMVIGAYFGP